MTQQGTAGSVDAGKGRKHDQETNLHHLPDFETCQVKIAKSPDKLYFCSFILITFAKPFRHATIKKTREEKELL